MTTHRPSTAAQGGLSRVEGRGTEALRFLRTFELGAAAPRCVVIVAMAIAIGLSAACGPNEPLAVAAIQTGKSLNSDNSIGTHSTSFRPQDTMYVSVLTGARGAGTITVRWKLGAQVIHEVTREVSYNDQAATDFRFEAADRFPVGTYTIEVLLDGKAVGERTVRVE
jgi:hypothetical protein